MSGFSIPLARLAETMKADLDTVVRKSTLQVFSAVVNRSPVATGRFRANWNVSKGAADFTTTDSTDKRRGSLEAAKALTLSAGGITYLSNGLPYADRLEYGYSKQAPSGMVRLSAQEFDAYVRKAAAT